MQLVSKPYADFVGKPRQELLDHLKATGAKIAGEKELKYLLAHPDEFPDMKDGNWYFFFEGASRDADGDWHVPCASWNGGAFSRDGFCLDNDWLSDERVVLIADSDSTTSSALESSPLEVEITEIKYQGKIYRLV